MNPFKEKSKPIGEYIQSFKDIYPKHYDKNATDPYTKCRIILAAGAEFEANWFSHNMMRNVSDMDLKRGISFARFIEKEQQQKISHLKPLDESTLETTIAYEQLAVDLTAEMAQKEENFYVKKALDFALLEDFDHLYRYSDLLDMDYGIHAERLVGKYTEITPARPTIAHHRHPYDNVKKDIEAKKNSTQTILNTMIITAAEQQTMNFYMNQAADYKNDLGRKLYEEICLVEEEHVTQYGSLIDTSCNLLESMLWHEYTECFVYWSNMKTETDKDLKKLWEYYLDAELSHLNGARQLLNKYGNKDYEEVILDPEFPEPISLHENAEYVRNILKNSVQFTGDKEDYKNISELDKDSLFFTHNEFITYPKEEDAGHLTIQNYIEKNGKDYRFEMKENPIKELRDKKHDNIKVGIDKNATKTEKGFIPLKKA